ncbi:hypothetical protein PAXINDRAFT_20642 [Paxillus involutus ATCC 200175]|uniref:Uncharacterized protein n=1 Tax=Paxillus involutus ATCC 200175 TaxID=664439 RepID=A0A0C9TDA2_PAXIN|nr:hypothetical protein PAXINDRAFT_20642 [Paxillus involutus ATCC 200175]
MDYQTLLREAADLSSFSWLLNPPVGDTAPQSDTFANVAFNLPTSPGSYTTLIPPRSHDSQSTYEGIFPETNSSANASSGTTLLDHPPQDFDRDHGDNSESSGSSLRIGPEVSYPIRIQEGNPASHARLSASVPMRGPYTPEDIPNPGETVLCDDLNFVTLHPDGLGRDHVCRVSFVYWVLQRSLAWHGCDSCPKARDPIAPSTPRDPVSSPFHRRSLSPPQADDINGLYLSPSLFDVALPLDDRQHRFNARLRELIARAAAADLHVPSHVLRIVARSDTQPAIPGSSSSNIVEVDTTEEQQTPANSTQPGDVTTLRFNAAPIGDLKKRHKIAKIKEILIDMLREIDFPLHNRYLPWSTLEGDLQKHGYGITNWPSGVPRENDKGIHTLRLKIVPGSFAVWINQQDQDMTPVHNGPGPKRRLDIAHNDGKGKRTKFKVTTAEYYASQSTDA